VGVAGEKRRKHEETARGADPGAAGVLVAGVANATHSNGQGPNKEVQSGFGPKVGSVPEVKAVGGRDEKKPHRPCARGPS